MGISDTRISLKINKKKSVTKTTGSDVREKGIKILGKFLNLPASDLKELEETINSATVQLLEREGLTDMNGLTAQRTYDQFLRKICLHLNPDSPVQNKYLFGAVKDGNINVADIATMSPIFMYPEAWSKQYGDQLLEAENVAVGVKKAAAKILTCAKCLAAGRNAKNVEYSEKQDRSADEAMTIHAHCLGCNAKWKQ
jgi:DNA-directed RNA polymerase subunit M/transcription elongation factor TFIIS